MPECTQGCLMASAITWFLYWRDSKTGIHSPNGVEPIDLFGRESSTCVGIGGSSLGSNFGMSYEQSRALP